jgi:hypothetical protein
MTSFTKAVRKRSRNATPPTHNTANNTLIMSCVPLSLKTFETSLFPSARKIGVKRS